MNEIKRSCFICFFFIFVLFLGLSISSTNANAGVANFDVEKLVDPTVGDTTAFPFTLQDDPQVDTNTMFELEDMGMQAFVLSTDEDYVLTESNPTGFIAVGAECSDGNGPLGSPDVEVTIDNEMDPSLMVDFSLMGTQQIQCTVTNTNDFQMLSVTTSGTGTGSVTATNGGGFPIGIDCPLDCTELVPDSTTITLDAAPDSGSEFTTWGDDCSGVNVQTMVMINGSDVSCDAQFDDIDECTEGTDNCDANAMCTNEMPGFDCDCNPGFEGDGTTGNCTDIDACTTTPCDANASCVDDPPPAPGDETGRTCTCDAGFEGDGEPGNCADIDACINNPCGTNATCTDNPAPALDDAAGRTCMCDPGFEGDPETMCTDIDACVNNPCDEDATCTDLPAPALDDTDGRTCECNPGFEGTGEPGMCQEIPECEGNDCDQLCLGADETDFICGCFGGFILDDDGKTCNPADNEIEIGNEETEEDRVIVLVEVGDDIEGGGTIRIDLPPQVRPEFASLDPGSGTSCTVVDPDEDPDEVDSIGNVLFEDADIICTVEDFPSAFDLEIGMCANDDTDEGIVNAEIEVLADGAPGEEFDEIIQILLDTLNTCADGGGCSIAPSNASPASGLSNLLVMLLPAIVVIGGVCFRRRRY